MENITNSDYMHAERVCEEFEIKNLGEYHDFNLKVIHYFWPMYSETSEKCVEKFIIWVIPCRLNKRSPGDPLRFC